MWGSGDQPSCDPHPLPCSAGVGRTGVFITLSIVLERMRYEGVVDIFQTVKVLRTQRPAMVQTEVRGRARDIPSAPLRPVPQPCRLGVGQVFASGSQILNLVIFVYSWGN